MKSPMILLAAGDSARVGIPKGLIELEIGEGIKPWLQFQWDRFVAAGGHRLVLVLGNHYHPYVKKFPWIEAATNSWLEIDRIHVAVIRNHHPEHGQFSSLLCGLQFLKNDGDSGVFVCPVDVPIPGDPQILSNLETIGNESTKIRIPTYKNRGGHPVHLNPTFTRDLLSLPATDKDSRLDYQIQKLSPDEIARWEVNAPDIVANLNSMNDYWQLGAKRH